MEIWKKCRNLGGTLEILRKFGKQIWKSKIVFWKSGKKIGNLEKIWRFGNIWKFGKNVKILKKELEIWKNFGNLSE